MPNAILVLSSADLSTDVHIGQLDEDRIVTTPQELVLVFKNLQALMRVGEIPIGRMMYKRMVVNPADPAYNAVVSLNVALLELGMSDFDAETFASLNGLLREQAGDGGVPEKYVETL